MRGQGGTIANRYSRLTARRQGAEEINRVFGLDIEVDFRADYREMDDEFMINQKEDGEVGIQPTVMDLRTRSANPNASIL